MIYSFFFGRDDRFGVNLRLVVCNYNIKFCIFNDRYYFIFSNGKDVIMICKEFI